MSSYVNDYCQSVQAYYKDLKRYNPIPREEEKILINRAKNHDLNARNKILTSNLKFVFDVARKYRGCGVSMPDLISEGNIGLTKAIDRFDEKKDVKFISYAVWWIKQSILDFIKKTNNTKQVEVDQDELNSSKTDSCITSDPVEDDQKPAFEFSFDDEKEELEEEENREAKNKQILESAMSVLDEREIGIIKAYFGIECDKEMNLEEIGSSLNLSSERVRQIKKNAIRKMRTEVIQTYSF